MIPRPRIGAALTLCAGVFLAESQRLSAADPAAFSLIEESAQVIAEKCFYPLTVPEILQGVMASLRHQGVDPSTDALPGVGALSEPEAWPVFKLHLEKMAAQPGQRLNLTDLIETGLGGFCPTIDTWTKYYTVADFARINRGGVASSGSIGVNLREIGPGEVYLYPLPGSPAGFAGIAPGDRLLSVDGRKLEGKPIELVASWIKGTPGTQTTLRVERRNGRSELVAIHREEIDSAPFQIEKELGGLTIRIRFFSPDLAQRVQEELAATSALRGLAIDLRGCTGGSMLAAVELADLFLPVGKRILSLSERGREVAHFDSQNEPVAQPRSFSILQDEGTGSAAEIFIAAVIENLPGQAGSAGTPSYGKGVVQMELPLAGGGKINLTTGMMFGPGGKSWNDVGLVPSISNGGQIFPEGAVSLANPTAKPKATIRLVE